MRTSVSIRRATATLPLLALTAYHLIGLFSAPAPGAGGLGENALAVATRLALEESMHGVPHQVGHGLPAATAQAQQATMVFFVEVDLRTLQDIYGIQQRLPTETPAASRGLTRDFRQRPS